ncbi:MAG: hypothetical protein PVI57_01590 [Gemmatimonadota bacterium]
MPARQAMAGEKGEESARPTPVRQAMEAERDAPQPVEPPTLAFAVGDQEWIARVEGRTSTGLPTDAGAPLLFVTFARAEAPDRRVLEATAVGRRLDDLSPGQLGALLDDASPLPDEWEPGEFFAGTRKGRGSRR